MYTGNQDYLDWAEQTWDWSRSVDMVSDSFEVFDGTDDTKGCIDMNHIQWSYNAGVYLYGAAVMWNVVSIGIRFHAYRLQDSDFSRRPRATSKDSGETAHKACSTLLARTSLTGLS